MICNFFVNLGPLKSTCTPTPPGSPYSRYQRRCEWTLGSAANDVFRPRGSSKNSSRRASPAILVDDFHLTVGDIDVDAIGESNGNNERRRSHSTDVSIDVNLLEVLTNEFPFFYLMYKD